jgi:hypothetical protein
MTVELSGPATDPAVTVVVFTGGHVQASSASPSPPAHLTPEAGAPGTARVAGGGSGTAPGGP